MSDFPSNPRPGQLHTQDGKTFICVSKAANRGLMTAPDDWAEVAVRDVICLRCGEVIEDEHYLPVAFTPKPTTSKLAIELQVPDHTIKYESLICHDKGLHISCPTTGKTSRG